MELEYLLLLRGIVEYYETTKTELDGFAFEIAVGINAPIYGLEAFSYSVGTILREFSILKCLFICCPIYQIFYITRHFIKKHKSKNVVVAPQGDLQNKN